MQSETTHGSIQERWSNSRSAKAKRSTRETGARAATGRPMSPGRQTIVAGSAGFLSARRGPGRPTVRSFGWGSLAVVDQHAVGMRDLNRVGRRQIVEHGGDHLQEGG